MTTPIKDNGRPPFPPFTAETARVKVKAAQDAWNTKFVLPAVSLNLIR
jgi:nuclear transport factor 2 (NTF2) superfamily protein